MKITLELYDTRYTVENDQNGQNAAELKDIFSRILVAASFPPSVIELEDGGRYEYVGEDEIVVKKEELNKEDE